jgi:hypothetical protein
MTHAGIRSVLLDDAINSRAQDGGEASHRSQNFNRTRFTRVLASGVRERHANPAYRRMDDLPR